VNDDDVAVDDITDAISALEDDVQVGKEEEEEQEQEVLRYSKERWKVVISDHYCYHPS